MTSRRRVWARSSTFPAVQLRMRWGLLRGYSSTPTRPRSWDASAETPTLRSWRTRRRRSAWTSPTKWTTRPRQALVLCSSLATRGESTERRHECWGTERRKTWWWMNWCLQIPCGSFGSSQQLHSWPLGRSSELVVCGESQSPLYHRESSFSSLSLSIAQPSQSNWCQLAPFLQNTGLLLHRLSGGDHENRQVLVWKQPHLHHQPISSFPQSVLQGQDHGSVPICGHLVWQRWREYFEAFVRKWLNPSSCLPLWMSFRKQEPSPRTCWTARWVVTAVRLDSDNEGGTISSNSVCCIICESRKPTLESSPRKSRNFQRPTTRSALWSSLKETSQSCLPSVGSILSSLSSLNDLRPLIPAVVSCYLVVKVTKWKRSRCPKSARRRSSTPMAPVTLSWEASSPSTSRARFWKSASTAASGCPRWSFSDQAAHSQTPWITNKKFRFPTGTF